MEDPKKKLSFLVKEINKSLEGTDSRREDYKSKAFLGYISTAVLAAISTILLGIKFDDINVFCSESNMEVWSKNIALIITAFIVVINAYNGFYNHKDLWIANNNTRNDFRKLLFDIDYAQEGATDITLDQVDEWKKEYQDIIDGMNSTWDKYRSQTK